MVVGGVFVARETHTMDTEEVVYDLTNAEVVDKYKAAADIANRTSAVTACSELSFVRRESSLVVACRRVGQGDRARAAGCSRRRRLQRRR